MYYFQSIIAIIKEDTKLCTHDERKDDENGLKDMKIKLKKTFGDLIVRKIEQNRHPT